MKLDFSRVKDKITGFSSPINWITASGLGEDELASMVSDIENAESSKAIIRAKTFELLLTKGRIAIDEDDIFQNKIFGRFIMSEQRWRWEKYIKATYFKEESEAALNADGKYATYSAGCDFGHISPNTRLMLSAGFSGLLAKVEEASGKAELDERRGEFYSSCKIVLSAMMTAANRLADAILPYNAENAAALRSIATGAPKNIYEAMQLLILYFVMHEHIGGARVRTLGRLDVLLEPFYKEDLKNGTFTKAEVKEMLKFFLYKFWVLKVPFDLPFCLGGMDESGNDVTSEMSYLIVEAYDELNIYSPKIHIRVSDKTPKTFVKRVLECIRHGNSSFVFVNDKIAIESLKRVGIDERDARDFVPIGCYEPAVWGVEIGCTGNGGVNLPKAVELVLCGGRDHKSGDVCGVPMDLPTSYDEFISAIKAQIKYMADAATDYITGLERHYGDIYPDPILSCQYEHSVECGVDVYEGGAKYNNSSLYFYSIASLVDSICAVREFVYDKKLFTLEQLGNVLRANWQGFEKERRLALRSRMKYGNGNAFADTLAKEMSAFCASIVNNKPNGRGGVFKAALFSIDICIRMGERTMATPDGRLAGEPLSKNLCASIGMDREGITSLIKSVTSIDLADFPTGSVLDVILHPSAVSGDDGLDTFYVLLDTYFKKGGFAMHGNVFDADTLKKAQANPEKYRNLQVRVCGWNAYFVNLSKIEQDCFIRQAEAIC